MQLLYKLGHRIFRKCQSLLGHSTLGARAIVLNEKNQILLVKHTYQPHWYIPGGGVKRGESARAACLRELEEEVGLTATAEPQLFGIYHHIYLGVNDYPVIYVVKNFTMKNVHSPEIEQIGWFDFNNLPVMTSPGTKRRLAEYHGNATRTDHW